MAHAPELLELIEEAFIEKLRADMPGGVEVKACPENPEDWTRLASKGCILVRYSGRTFDKSGPPRPNRKYLQTVRMQVFAGAPGLRASAQHAGGYRLLAQTMRSILGSAEHAIDPLAITIPNSSHDGPIWWEPSVDGFYDEKNATWWYVSQFTSTKFDAPF